jgi:hypothetical protein
MKSAVAVSPEVSASSQARKTARSMEVACLASLEARTDSVWASAAFP